MKVRYYDIQRHWTKRIEPHLGNKELSRILVRDFNKYTMGRWGQRFKPGQFPEEFETCDWRCDHRGPYPRYWRYVKHAACHWLVNFALELARLTEPEREWRILTSQLHSTVFDGKRTLFDLNFLALGVSAMECFAMAIVPQCGGRELPVGRRLRVYLAEHYSIDQVGHDGGAV